MKTVKLNQRIKSIKAASDFEHTLIDSLYNIMAMKRKAEAEYRSNLQLVSRQLDRYVISDNGFLIEMVRSFQSYINVVSQNQSALIDGYDNQILTFLAKAKQSKLQKDILQKVDFVDQKIEACKEQVKHFKKLIRQNEEDIQYVSSEVAFKGHISPLSEEQKRSLGQKFTDLQNLKRINEQNLEQHVDGMMDLTMIHNQTIDELNEYETVYLQQKASDVYDNFMRAFVLEVSYIRSMSFDVTSILQKVNDRKDENKRIAFDNLRQRMDKVKGIKQSLWDTYRKWTASDSELEIKDNFISPRIRDKWRRVCEYYNHAIQ